MHILFDQGTPAPLRHALPGHQVETAFERGWSNLRNGDLLSAAEKHGFSVFVTTDRHLKYQQNLGQRSLAIVVLLSTSWPRMQHVLTEIASAIDTAAPGSYLEIRVENSV